MMSESNKQQAVNKLTEIVANFTAMISTRMPDDVVDKLKQLKDAETSSMGKIIYHTMFDNMQKAIDLNRPACQDTGEIMFFVKVGSRFPLLGELQSILKQAVEEATVKAPLRHNAVEIFDEVNTGKNTGSGVPWVTWDIIPDNDDAEIEVYMAGGGCTLPGRSKVLMPSEGYEGVVKFVFENISTLAVNACPPVLVGVGIATSVETAAVLSRKAILRPIGSRHPNPKAAELELRLEEGLNRLGIGPQGLTGNSSVMGVHIESAARHPSTIGVAVPGAVVAMVGISIIAILSPWLLFSPEQLAQPGFKFTAKSLSWAVSGFSNSVIWLIFAAFMFGTGYEKTGLGRRIALFLVKKMGHRTLFLGYAVMFSELILAPVTPSNSARGAGIIYPIIRNLPPLYQSQPNDSSSRSIGSYIMWMGIVADCVTSAIFLTAMAPNLLLIGLMKSASHATLSWGDWFLGMLPLSILLVLLVPWLAYVLYPPVLKSGDQVPRWAETELQAMGPLCSREKRMLGLMVGALVLWIFGGDYIDAAMVGYSVVALMLLLRIISWDDIVSNKAAWNVFFWLASLITLATGLNNTGFISWFGKLLAGSLSGYSPTMVMVALIVVFYLLRYFFASATAYTSALAPMMIAAALAMPEIPLPVFCLMVGAAIGLGSILTPYATGPSPIYYGSGYLPTVDYWRLGAIFGLIFLVLLVITGLLWMPVVLL